MESLLKVEDAFACNAMSEWPCRLMEKTHTQGKSIELIQKHSRGEKKVNVFMKLIGQCPKHYIALFRTDDCEHQFGHFNSAQCRVSRMPDNGVQFLVSQFNDEDGLLFEASCPSEAEEWIRIFLCHSKCPYSPRNRRSSRAGDLKKTFNK